LEKKRVEFFYVIAAIIICDISQLIIAFDITRMLCLGFPVIILSAEKIKEEWEPIKFTRFLLGLTLINFLVIQYGMTSNGLGPMFPTPYNWLINLLNG
jgi:hypothetical protein